MVMSCEPVGYTPALVRYIGGCIGINEPIRAYQNHNTGQTLTFGGYLKVTESLYTRVIIWVCT